MSRKCHNDTLQTNYINDTSKTVNLINDCQVQILTLDSNNNNFKCMCRKTSSLCHNVIIIRKICEGYQVAVLART